mgnify:CR=1 FL=1
MNTAKYFNGQSTTPFEVVYEYDLVNHLIHFTHHSFSHTWDIQECYLDYSNQQLSISQKNGDGQLFLIDKVDIKAIKSSTKNSTFLLYYQKLIDAGMGAHALIMLGIVGIILFSNFYVIPAVAEKAVDLLPTSYDKSLGNTFYDEYLDYETVDSSRTELAQAFMNELKFDSDNEYIVTVVESNQVNAFALPNGAIVVYSGLLDQLETYEEFAALLGHEAAHVNLRHSMKMLCRNLSTYIFISAIFSDVNGVISVLAENAHQLQSLTYSRSLEEEADHLSAITMVENNIDPVGLQNLFEKLAQDSSSYIPEFLRTHPISEKRIEKAISFAEQESTSYRTNDQLFTIFEKIRLTKTNSYEE